MTLLRISRKGWVNGSKEKEKNVVIVKMAEKHERSYSSGTRKRDSAKQELYLFESTFTHQFKCHLA